ARPGSYHAIVAGKDAFEHFSLVLVEREAARQSGGRELFEVPLCLIVKTRQIGRREVMNRLARGLIAWHGLDPRPLREYPNPRKRDGRRDPHDLLSFVEEQDRTPDISQV